MIKKQDAIELLGGKAVRLSEVLNKTRSAISQWGDDLTDDQINMVIGAAWRKGIEIPDKFRL